ncbi:hypothetical protein H6F86_30215 [Phormidium sp. FACHB-592]|uniref:Uncharacterized protein n=1 Tax=Stenomitos frigidus AS-A4 TaxID=2933935 RepID=A0ABV0KGE0_9CYAN|nr:hypothetical protein [Phormidium sp. FACHB-592]MBD2078090.1 hypothetical protein [Phormidium sp. FACHB-592]
MLINTMQGRNRHDQSGVCSSVNALLSPSRVEDVPVRQSLSLARLTERDRSNNA